MLAKLDNTKDQDAIGHFTNEHIKMSGVYWCIGSMRLIGKLPLERRDEFISFVKSCQHKCGGFGGNVGHDPHITTSLYAVLILSMFDAVDEINCEKLAEYFKSL